MIHNFNDIYYTKHFQESMIIHILFDLNIKWSPTYSNAFKTIHTFITNQVKLRLGTYLNRNNKTHGSISLLASSWYYSTIHRSRLWFFRMNLILTVIYYKSSLGFEISSKPVGFHSWGSVLIEEVLDCLRHGLTIHLTLPIVSSIFSCIRNISKLKYEASRKNI